MTADPKIVKVLIISVIPFIFSEYNKRNNNMREHLHPYLFIIIGFVIQTILDSKVHLQKHVGYGHSAKMIIGDGLVASDGKINLTRCHKYKVQLHLLITFFIIS